MGVGGGRGVAETSVTLSVELPAHRYFSAWSRLAAFILLAHDAWWNEFVETAKSTVVICDSMEGKFSFLLFPKWRFSTLIISRAKTVIFMEGTCSCLRAAELHAGSLSQVFFSEPFEAVGWSKVEWIERVRYLLKNPSQTSARLQCTPRGGERGGGGGVFVQALHLGGERVREGEGRGVNFGALNLANWASWIFLSRRGIIKVLIL